VIAQIKVEQRSGYRSVCYSIAAQATPRRFSSTCAAVLELLIESLSGRLCEGGSGVLARDDRHDLKFNQIGPFGSPALQSVTSSHSMI